jgi:hypothetical protein
MHLDGNGYQSESSQVGFDQTRDETSKPRFVYYRMDGLRTYSELYTAMAHCPDKLNTKSQCGAIALIPLVITEQTDVLHTRTPRMH